MAELTKQALIVENNQSFPNNNAGAITPSILRNFNTDIIDSTVNQAVYTADSGSWNEKIDGLSTGSALITASVDVSTITFTKGDGSQFELTVTASVATIDWDNVTDKPAGLVSGSSQVVDILTSVNSFTSSQESKDSTLASYTGSVDTKFATIGTQSGSWENVPLTSLNSFTASQESKDSTLASYTGSVNTQLTNLSTSQSIDNTKWTTLGSQSGSWVNESETGSFARVDVSNTFTADQTITGTLNVNTLNATTIHTIIESSSVIYSSGSNVFGDAADDIQTLNGSVNVVNQLTASGLHYPTADNGVKSFIQTDGAGNLSLQYVDTIWENVRAGQSVPKGTPLYISGSQGANPIVYAADASNPAKMPVTFIAGDTYTAGTTYPATVLGLIEGLDLTGYTAGQTVYAAEGGGWSTSLPSGSNSITQVLGVVTKGGSGGKGLVLNPGPAQLPNLQTGYAWVGNGSNQPIAIATSSFAENTDLGPLNAFTASQELINTALNASTASQQISIDALNSFTASYTPTDLTSLNAFTSSQESKDSTLASYTGSVNTQLTNLSTSQSIDNDKFTTIGTQSGSWENIPLTSLNAFTQSQELLNTQLLNASTSFEEKFETIGTQSGSWGGGGSVVGYATTGSNTFVGNQTISGSDVKNGITLKSGSEFFIGQNGSDNLVISSSTNDRYIEINPNSGWMEVYPSTTNFNNGVNFRGQINVRNVATDIGNGHVAQFDGFSASLQEGYAWVGNGSGFNSQVATSSFAGGGSTDITALNAFTASQESKDLTLATYTGSIDEKFATIGTQSGSWSGGGTDLTSLNAFTSSQQILNAQFADTGSNTFVGTQTITEGGVDLLGQNPSFRIQGNAQGSGSQYPNLSVTVAPNIYPGNIFGGFSIVREEDVVAGLTFIGMAANSYTPQYGPVTVPMIIAAGNNPDDSDTAIIFAPDGTAEHYKNTAFKYDVDVTGSLDVQSTFTSSLQEGYVWVGDSTGRTTTVPTSSFGGGGSAFPYTGTASISGSLQVTGSMSGYVNTITVSSTTASVDFNNGNLFLLTLPSGSTTQIQPTNIKAGQTINIQISQQTPGTGSVSFPSNVKFAGGNDYQSTATGSAIDLLTFISIDGTNVLATSIKNFL